MEVDRIDAAILAEELTEIYSTPTPKVMQTGIPIFCQVVVTIVVTENDTPLRLQIERANPAILAP